MQLVVKLHFQFDLLLKLIGLYAQLPNMFKQLRQEVVDDVMNLYVQFDSLRNDMKFRYENLQTAIINMER